MDFRQKSNQTTWKDPPEHPRQSTDSSRDIMSQLAHLGNHVQEQQKCTFKLSLL